MSKSKDRCCTVFVTAPPCGCYPQPYCNYPSPCSNNGCNNGCSDGFGGNNAWWIIILLLFGGFGGWGC